MKANKLINSVKRVPYAVANFLEAEIREKVSHGPERTGKHYSGNPSRSSAPGEPPKKQSGYLTANNHLFVEKSGEYTYNVILTADYAGTLEFGSKKMKPRPFVKPTIEEVIKKLNDKK